MKKALLILAAAAVATTSVHAHRVWVQTDHTHGDQILNADLGYGEFPELEPIPSGRLAIFSKPMQLHTPAGKQDLVQKGKFNYQYQSKAPVKEGSYLVTAEYQPTFWSKNAEGWKQANLKQLAGATYCEESRMYGKMVLNVGHDSADTKTITQPVGQLLEIVPLDNPANVHVGKPFKVQVLYKGEPLAGATVTATFAGFDTSDRKASHKTEAQAFSDTTGADGSVSIIPLRQGFWKASVEHKADYANPSVCQKQSTYTTLTFDIGHVHH